MFRSFFRGRAWAFYAFVAVVASAAAGCAGEEPERVLAVSVDLGLADSVPIGTPFDIGFTWTPGEDFAAPADDFRVFVHLVDPDGNIVQQDDHYPPVPTSQWKAGQPVNYRRWLYPNSR